jgi:hypothetical protein
MNQRKSIKCCLLFFSHILFGKILSVSSKLVLLISPPLLAGAFFILSLKDNQIAPKKDMATAAAA